MNDTVCPLHLVPGDPRHGVAIYARQVARICGAVVSDAPPGPRTVAVGPVHLHFTDRIWGDSPEAAAAAIEALATQHSVSVTLHDLPRPSDGPLNHPRRADCYRRVAAASRGIVCNSHHEAALLREVLGPLTGRSPAIIPLPVVAAPRTAGRPRPRSEVALLGFIYPGKGHLQAIEAVARTRGLDPEKPAVVALGTTSPGHAAETDALRVRADELGVRFSVSGYLNDEELIDRCRRAAVPLAAHRQISASGSIGTWIAAGRRPLVADSRYAREIDVLRPGTVYRYPANELSGAIAGALIDPACTWLGDDAVLAPDLADVASAYVHWWTRRVCW
ncbi:MAG: hypothetical protein M3022_05360 [Actinomycetota bacterium]|nr:hypothetical protein [Actinomycetota bacterium]